MAVALKLDIPPPDADAGIDLPDLVPGTLKAWRTKQGTPLGVTARLASGQWIAMTPDDEITVYDEIHDASLHLTLAYMRRPR
jgi:hypothetical protein